MKETLILTLQDAWKVLIIGLVLGAGLPALFAVGIRGYAMGAGEMDVPTKRNPMGLVIAGVCWFLVAAAVLMGLAVIVSSGFGYKAEFSHIIPTFHKK